MVTMRMTSKMTVSMSHDDDDNENDDDDDAEVENGGDYAWYTPW